MRDKVLQHFANPSNAGKFIVKVEGDISYYIPLPADTIVYHKSNNGIESCLRFEHREIPKSKMHSQASGVDDCKGTFIQSSAIIAYLLSVKPEFQYFSIIEDKSLEFVNTVLKSVRHVKFDPSINLIDFFQNTSINLWEINKNGSIVSAGTARVGQNFGPHGLRLQAELDNESINEMKNILIGKRWINPSWDLVIDAKKHKRFDDINRSILDLATALEIHIPNLIKYYKKQDNSLHTYLNKNHNVYKYYNSILPNITGSSLHNRPKLYIKLEYIYQLRNNVIHSWTPRFKFSNKFRKESKYIKTHKKYENKLVSSKKEVDELINSCRDILKFVEFLFDGKYN